METMDALSTVVAPLFCILIPSISIYCFDFSVYNSAVEVLQNELSNHTHDI